MFMIDAFGTYVFGPFRSSEKWYACASIEIIDLLVEFSSLLVYVIVAVEIFCIGLVFKRNV